MYHFPRPAALVAIYPGYRCAYLLISSSLRTYPFTEKLYKESFPGKGQPKTHKIKNWLWQCVIYHIKEENLNFNMQKSLALYYLDKKVTRV